MQPALPQRTYPPLWRVAFAFVIVPGLAAFLMAMLMPAYNGLSDPFERIWRTAALFAMFGAYPTAVVVGIPAYFLLRRRFEPKPINCGLAGAVVATLPWLMISLLGPGSGEASVGGRATMINGGWTAFGWLLQLEFLAQIAAFGMFAGGIFWIIAAAGSRAVNDR